MHVPSCRHYRVQEQSKGDPDRQTGWDYCSPPISNITIIMAAMSLQGAKLKELGTVAREKLEKFLQRKVS